uniref:Ribosomal protein S5 n=1 Tax=Chromerida sp. RM11 TaxID=348535 RepID=D9IXQ8_9ALVE|nr:ribosomal protein S5 [Chromerida sp. RM11]ADJ66625.1 ribosomal protein S5 [Chromerida sp. RM11]
MTVRFTKKPKTGLRFSAVLSRKLSRYKTPTLNPEARPTSGPARPLPSHSRSPSTSTSYCTFTRTKRILRHLSQPSANIENKALLHDYIQMLSGTNMCYSVPDSSRELFGVKRLSMCRLKEAKLHRKLTAKLSYALSGDSGLSRDALQYKKLFEHRLYSKLMDKLRTRGAAFSAITESHLDDTVQRTDLREQYLFSGLTYLSATGRRSEFVTNLPRLKELIRQSRENIQFILLELGLTQAARTRKLYPSTSAVTSDRRIRALRKVLRILKKVGRSESPLTALIANASGVRVSRLSELLANRMFSLAALSTISTKPGKTSEKPHKSLFKLLSPMSLQPLTAAQSSSTEKERSLINSLTFKDITRRGELEVRQGDLASTSFGQQRAQRELPQKHPILQEVLEYRGVSRTRAGGRSRRFRVLLVIGRKTGWVGVGLGKHKYIPEAIQKAKRDAARNISFLRRTAVGSISNTVKGKFKKAHVLLKPLPVGSGMMTGSCLKNVLVLAGYSNVWGLQMGTPNKICNVKAVLDALGQLRSDVEIIGARQSKRDDTKPQESLVCALKLYAETR